MKCAEVIERYFDLDHGEPLPAEIATHIETCTSCRELIGRMNSGMQLLSVSNTGDIKDTGESRAAFTDTVMHRIRSDSATTANDPAPSEALGRWIVTGIIIIAALPLASFSRSAQWLHGILGGSLDFPMNLVLGLLVAVYSLLFIGSHLKAIARWLHLRPEVVRRKTV